MKKLFVDCEYNGFNGEMISMALCAEDGAEWYEVLGIPTQVDPWVAEHVIPILGKRPIGRAAFVASLEAFLARYPKGVCVVADWPEDISHFCRALITGPGVKCTTPPLFFQIIPVYAPSDMPHNALEDARGIRSAILGGRFST